MKLFKLCNLDFLFQNKYKLARKETIHYKYCYRSLQGHLSLAVTIDSGLSNILNYNKANLNAELLNKHRLLAYSCNLNILKLTKCMNLLLLIREAELESPYRLHMLSMKGFSFTLYHDYLIGVYAHYC